jgi:hypothetical protein
MNRCSVCGRPLTAPESIKYGMGPVCRKRYKKQLIEAGVLKVCSTCRRPLTDTESIERGMGPVCYRKYLATKSLPVKAYCKRCGAVLTDLVSIERGMGKICFEKYQSEHQALQPAASVTGP